MDLHSREKRCPDTVGQEPYVPLEDANNLIGYAGSKREFAVAQIGNVFVYVYLATPFITNIYSTTVTEPFGEVISLTPLPHYMEHAHWKEMFRYPMFWLRRDIAPQMTRTNHANNALLWASVQN